jgi:hypothetical protein
MAAPYVPTSQQLVVEFYVRSTRSRARLLGLRFDTLIEPR